MRFLQLASKRACSSKERLILERQVCMITDGLIVTAQNLELDISQVRNLSLHSLFYSWKRICVQHEDMDKFWHDPKSTLDFYELKDQHFATVDVVHVMKSGDLCISGSRDRSVGVWSLNALTDPIEEGYSKNSFKQALDGHKVSKIHFIY